MLQIFELNTREVIMKYGLGLLRWHSRNKFMYIKLLDSFNPVRSN